MLKQYVWKILNFLNRYIASPRMILGYKTIEKKWLPKTRISNTVEIVCRDKLNIEDNVFVWHHTIIECSNGVTICEGCQIGANVLIASHSSHIAIRLYGRHYIGQKEHIGYVKGSIFIGKYTFIGPNSIIMPGSKIGKGSIVSAYSLVKGEFPDYAILAGNPAIQIGDTREIDKKYLVEHPELNQYYNEWVN